MPTLKDRASKVVDRAAKNIQKQVSGSIDSVVDRTESLRKEFDRRVEETAEQTQSRAARLALSVVDLQKTTYDHTFKVIAQLQEKSEGAVSKVLQDSKWLPGEGKAVVKEWVQLLKASRTDFNKTVGKSFDLITDYLKRVEAEAHKSGAKKKASAKKKAPAKAKASAKATPAKPKAPAKKKAVAKKKATVA